MELETTVELSGTDRSGAAVARAGGERLLVHGGIPGERVRVRPGRRVGHGVLAELLEVIEPSPHRVVPRCRHAAVCGGCTWQHVAYDEQLRIKTRVVASVLRHALHPETPPVLPAIGTPAGPDGMPWGFRQKATFVFAQEAEGALAMGHFARGTHEVVPVVECPVHPERANRVAFALRDALRGAGVPAAGAQLTGLARHVLVRTTGDGAETVALLVATRPDASLEASLRLLASGPERPDGVALNLHDRPGPFLVGKQTLRVAGAGHVREAALGPAFLVSPTAFFQTNVAAAAVLLRLVTEAMPSPVARVLDLYSGSGLFALPLAVAGHSVVAVEESRKGVRDAELNLKVNAVPRERLRLVASSAESALPHLDPAAFDIVVLDPPREGASPRVLREVFGRLRPPRVVLVSCDTDALAHELRAARAAGYTIRSVQPVDMFPHTPHIEAVAVLDRGAATRSGRGQDRGRGPRDRRDHERSGEGRAASPDRPRGHESATRRSGWHRPNGAPAARKGSQGGSDRDRAVETASPPEATEARRPAGPRRPRRTSR
jgi:23S rRNA (uracil1939-C5)-methyltransferase